MRNNFYQTVYTEIITPHLVFLGDIHGEFETLKKVIKNCDLSDCLIFCVGDFGVGFSRPEKEQRRLQNLNEFFRQRSIDFLSIAGNHDDPSYFQGQTNLSNLRLIPDYQYLNINGKKVLTVGGAISIDRLDRKEGYSYWSDEIIKPAPDNLEPADIIVAHDAPLWAGKDASSLYDTPLNPVKTDAVAGRTILGNVIKQTNPRLFVHGHYHVSSSFFFEGVKYRGLDINELWSCFC